MRAAIYDIATGIIKRFVEVIPSQLDIQCQTGEEFFLNCPETATHIIGYQPITRKPDMPGVSREELLRRVRVQRDLLLNEIDVKYCNAERWSRMTPEQQDLWSEHKQKLRDFPALCDLNNPAWPPKPA